MINPTGHFTPGKKNSVDTDRLDDLEVFMEYDSAIIDAINAFATEKAKEAYEKALKNF